MSVDEQRGAPGYVGVDQLDGNVETVVAGSRPQVNSGSGFQIGGDVGVVLISESQGRERRKRARPLSHSAWRREYLSKRFVPPRKFEAAQDALARNGTVFISGADGSGRQSTAEMLLWLRFPDNEVGFRRLTFDNEEDVDERPLDAESVQRGERLLLDLSAETGENVEPLRRDLDTFRAAVEREGAALVVVLPVDFEQLLGDEATNPRVVIERPDGSAVIRSHLLAENIPESVHELDALGESRASEPMRGLERLVARIVQAEERNPEAGFAQWAKSATETVAEYVSKVAGQVKNYSLGQRTTLLAASMVEGAHPDSAHVARHALQTGLGYPQDDGFVLERTGLADALKNIAAGVENGRAIKFESPRYAEAVREYFWSNFPELREHFRDWVGICLAMDELTDADQDRMVARFAVQACRTGRTLDLWVLAERWTAGGGRGTHHRSAVRWAASALGYGLQDDSSLGGASELRRKIYEAASRGEPSEDLARVLVLVCANVMAEEHPEQALVRLRLLAGHPTPDVAETARSAVRDLTSSDRLYRRFLWRMVAWLENPRPADPGLFLLLARAGRVSGRGPGSRVLLHSKVIRQQLAACWYRVLPLDESVWRSSVRDWLDAAGTAPHGDLFLDVLVDAARGRLSVLARLHVVARDWAHQHGNEQGARDREVARRLAVRLDRAQEHRLYS